LSVTELTIVPKQASRLAAIARDANHAQDRERLTGERFKLRESPRDFAACCAKCSLSCRGFSPATVCSQGDGDPERLAESAGKHRGHGAHELKHAA